MRRQLDKTSEIAESKLVVKIVGPTWRIEFQHGKPDFRKINQLTLNWISHDKYRIDNHVLDEDNVGSP